MVLEEKSSFNLHISIKVKLFADLRILHTLKKGNLRMMSLMELLVDEFTLMEPINWDGSCLVDCMDTENNQRIKKKGFLKTTIGKKTK